MLESYVTRTRDKAAALAFMKKALKRHGSPDAITTDGLRSYGAALDELGCHDRQEVGRWANNRVENSHLPFRQMKTLHKFASVHANIHNRFNLERHLTDRQIYRERAAQAVGIGALPRRPQSADGREGQNLSNRLSDTGGTAP
ncbi:DDE-type integrase/transposase/recombinase [uncultured Sphingomonas sp.]|uniref:DDE-type integrase/transposase/recombinase n=1 Tax=uncultured Sphingomonas sp. TaxID=158754 RepID=UPI0026119F5A|nr:DDE-type integrase/transposase/recombinase [uncultured Sphingomonas sp.]